MGNEIEKSFWATIKGTLQGINNEGSAKRATTFYLVTCILTPLIGVFCWGFIVAVYNPNPTTIHTVIVGAFITLVLIVSLTILTLLGFATLELITSIVKKVTGQNTNEKGTNPDTK